jgi:hypothetical protein
VQTRRRDGSQTASGSGTGHSVRVTRTAHSTYRRAVIPALPGSGAACLLVLTPAIYAGGSTTTCPAEPVTVGGALGGLSSSVAGEATVCRGLEDWYGLVCGCYLPVGGLMVSASVSLGEPE